ncbi:MAG TPA: DNA polymerase Y family protein, partial [Methylibium sp.]|nr:DNA polymerase Y family protein [Methylibium sp.]
MLWIALYLPHLPLQALERALPGQPPRPALAVVDDRKLIAINRAAAMLGLRLGQSAATAQSLAPQLQLRPRDPDRERAFVQALALALGQFTPQLCPQAGGVLIEVAASLRLFGGLRRLRRRIEAVVRQCGARARLATGRTANAAWLLASHGATAAPAAQGSPARSRDARRLDALPL